MNKISVFFFSGTGNSRYAARSIAALTGGELVDMGKKIKENDFSEVAAGENAVFVTPTYCWRIPAIVSGWIEKVQFRDVKRAWFVMTCGSDIGAASEYNEAICKSKGFEYMGTAQILMPENYLAMFNVPEEAECQEIIRSAAPAIRDAARSVMFCETLCAPKIGLVQRIKSGPVTPRFYKYCVKADSFTVDDKCISCGLCASLCPTNTVKLTDGKPQWGGGCTHCMACISRCPRKAIEYGKASKGKHRYCLE